MHQTANQRYIEEGVQLLELAQRSHVLFESQPPVQKRKLLDFVLSNCMWKNGDLAAEYRQPFDLIAAAAQADRLSDPSRGLGNRDFGNWR